MTYALLLQESVIPPNLVTPLMFGLMIGIFWLFIIRPQNRRQKQQTNFQEALSKGQRVVTTSGILGRISKLDKEAGTVTLEAGKNTYLELTASSISRELTEAKYGDDAAA